MSISKASAEWNGTLKAGKGAMRPAHGGEIPFSFGTRFEGAQGSNPEELIGAALAGCFSMALSLGLEQAGITPDSIRSSAKVHLEKDGAGFGIPRIELSLVGRVPGLDEAAFKEAAEGAKAGCPVSKALASVPEITLDARLEGE